MNLHFQRLILLFLVGFLISASLKSHAKVRRSTAVHFVRPQTTEMKQAKFDYVGLA